MSSKKVQRVKKLLSVLTNYTLMTAAREKTIKNARITETSKNSENDEFLATNLIQIPCIQYLINFRKKSVLTLFDSGNEVNTI